MFGFLCWLVLLYCHALQKWWVSLESALAVVCMWCKSWVYVGPTGTTHLGALNIFLSCLFCFSQVVGI